MQPSPYTPGEVARAVPGRGAQLAEADERLSSLIDLHRLVGRIRVDHAPRGFGKTSLLREYQRRALARGAVTIWVTAGEAHGLVEQICDAISGATASFTETARARIRDRIEECEAVDRALSVAQGYPYTVQLIADAAWIAAGRPDAGGHVDVAAVERGRITMRADLDALFRARWASCTSLERRVLAAMAGRGDGPVSRAEIASELHATTNSLSTPRARLIDKGLIQPTDRGMLEFTIPGFAEFIRDREDR